jgi:hypothetical protein
MVTANLAANAANRRRGTHLIDFCSHSIEIEVDVDGIHGGRSTASVAAGGRSVGDFKFADYFERKVLQKRPYLRKEWCIAVVERPTRSEPQGDSRYRFWAPITELGGRYLRVITLADKVTILNAFPDRGFKP